MVLVSHLYKFIYIKNKKVAGTSVETFFGKYCIDQNKPYHYSEKTEEVISIFGIIGSRMNKYNIWCNLLNLDKWYNHKPATLIKRDLPNGIFDRYFKFCVVRNPWDALVSRYHWDKSNLSFIDWIKKYDFQQQNNWDIYTINDIPVCNFYIRFENLKEDIIKVCKILKITNYNLDDLPNYKSNYRNSKKHYREYYDSETQNIVYQKYKKEIQFFDYAF